MNLMSLYCTYLAFFDGVSQGNERWKERIKKEFRDSMNLPRKKKKAVRKRLYLEWDIANWNPFNYNY